MDLRQSNMLIIHISNDRNKNYHIINAENDYGVLKTKQIIADNFHLNIE